MRDFKDIRVAVAGTGYVGLSIATLLSQHHHVTAVDVIPEKVEKLNNRISPIQDDYIEKYLAEKPLDLHAVLSPSLQGGTGKASPYADADFVVIAAPTNYDPVKNYFDTTHVEEVIDLEEDTIEPAPKFGNNISGEYIRGIGKKDNKFIIILDIDKVFSTEEIVALKAAVVK